MVQLGDAPPCPVHLVFPERNANLLVYFGLSGYVRRLLGILGLEVAMLCFKTAHCSFLRLGFGEGGFSRANLIAVELTFTARQPLKIALVSGK
jgi:hypothetical protein